MSSKEKDALHEIFLAGLGLLSSGRGELRKSIDKAVKEGKLRRKEGQKLFHEMSKKTEKQRSEIKEVIEEEINKAFSKLGIATPSDMSRVLHRIERIENKAEKAAKTKKRKRKSRQKTAAAATAIEAAAVEIKPEPAPQAPEPETPPQDSQPS